jgi:hypothetical protein
MKVTILTLQELQHWQLKKAQEIHEVQPAAVFTTDLTNPL